MMEVCKMINRQIFMVYAHVVDATGKLSILDGYPKAYDSQHYGNDVDKTQNRALADAHGLLADMYTKDTRQLQLVKVETADGFAIYKQTIGALAPLPDSE